MPRLSRLGGCLILLAWLGSYFPLRRDRKLVVFSLPVSFWLMLQESAFLPGMGILVFALSFLSKDKEEEPGSDFSVYLLTILFYSIFFLFYKFSPYAWYYIQSLSLDFSATVTAVAGNKMTLGATAAGTFITISVLCYCLALVFHKRKLFFFLLAMSIPVFVNVLYLCLQKPMTDLVHLVDKTLKPNPAHFLTILLIFLILSLFPLNRKMVFNGFQLTFSRKSRAYAFLCVSLFFVSMLIISFYFKGNRRNGEIVFCNKGADFSVPYYGKRYGQHSVGMFGMLPHYLNMRGYKTRILKKPLSRKILKNASMLVVFNPNRFFSGPERLLIYEFVEKGGALLVAGDHTDVSGVMKPINDLIAPFSMKLKFDTALPVTSGWVHSLEKRPHPITRGMKEDHEAGIWVGASLKISPPARPVIIGKYGWADIGNYMNIKRAYLGDYRRGSDEQFGDIVLVAESVYGKGRVMVFGDTSTFQSGIISNIYFFVDRIFNHMSSRGEPRRPMKQLFPVLFLVAAACFLLVRTPSPVVVFASIIAVHTAIFFSSFSLSLETARLDPVKASAYKPAYIDISHMERFSVFASADNSAWGICVNLMRNRYIPLLMKEFSKDTLLKSDLLIVIAPTVGFTKKETEVLKEFMEKGGTVIWSVGWEELAASESFLSEFGFSIDAVPLASAKIDLAKGRVKFVEAWPVMSELKSGHVILEKWDYPVMVRQPVGLGGLVVIGDSWFLLSMNIESYKNYDINNIRFFKYIIDRLVKQKPYIKQDK